jgi:LysM repeat protein
MSSIRPLITVIILTAVGAFLYVKINEAPLRPLPQEGEAALHPTANGVPPLDLKAGAATAGGSTSAPANTTTLAPQWPGSKDTNTLKTAIKSGTAQPPAPTTPELPPIPELPAFPGDDSTNPLAGDLTPKAPTQTPAATNAAPAATVATERTNDGQPSRYNAESSTSDVNSRANPTADSTANLTAPSQAGSQALRTEHDTAAENAMAAMGLTPAPTAQPTTPVTSADNQSTAPPVSVPATADRYGLGIGSTAPSDLNSAGSGGAASTPAPRVAAPMSAQSFASAWSLIDAALQKGELARAHQMLSPWHGNQSLTPVESQQVEKLLGQLAGTVIYSTEHRLEPPYLVRQGETLESIARQHDVPWQLLAKINGVPPTEPLRPGQQLKVVRGPFEGVLDLRRKQLSLKLDGRYAGKFAVSGPTDASFPPGEWRVVDKPAAPVARPSVYGGAASGAPAVSRSLLLANAAATAANPGVQIQIGASAATAAATGEINGLRAERAGGSPYVIQVSPRDAEELADILSLGSRVVILR